MALDQEILRSLTHSFFCLAVSQLCCQGTAFIIITFHHDIGDVHAWLTLDGLR